MRETTALQAFLDHHEELCVAVKGAIGAQGRDRTTDTAIFSRMLYQLSYLAGRRDVRVYQSPRYREMRRSISISRASWTSINSTSRRHSEARASSIFWCSAAICSSARRLTS